MEKQPGKFFFGLLQWRTCALPTWRGMVLLLLMLNALFFLAVKSVHPFLARNVAVPSKILVAEGWMSDLAFQQVVAEFRRNHYEKLYVTGGPLERGALLAEYKSYAELGAAIVVGMGLPKDAVEAVPAPYTVKDRTYVSALTLKKRLEAPGRHDASLQIMSVGPHARRTHLLFQKALGDEVRIGITAIEPGEYDPARWWTSSAGVREVVGESIAFVYAWLVFRPFEEA